MSRSRRAPDDPGQATPGQGVPLWRLLQEASHALGQVRAGRSLTPVLEKTPPPLRAGAQALSFHAMRWLGSAQCARDLLLQRVAPGPLDDVLCVALTLLLPDEKLYDEFTVVNQAVEAVKRNARTRFGAGFLNACLRRCLKERQTMAAAIQGDDLARWNFPRWWIERLRADHPQGWAGFLQGAQRPAPLILRVNARRRDAADYLAQLARQGIEARRWGPTAVEIVHPLPIERIPGFLAGDVSVQSATAQRAAALLADGLVGQARVLDACAAPGGKTAHLLELRPDLRVLALDMDAARSRRIGENLQRLDLRAEVQVADAAQPGHWWDGRHFDAILLDAPCSGSGIVRRHPDIRWLRRASDIDALAARQDRLLRALWPLLRPGGRMLFCTCSVFRAEGDARLEAFLQCHNDASDLASPGHLLPASGGNSARIGDNQTCDDDGFYYALLEKRPARAVAVAARLRSRLG
ncbi:MAG: 16S rRNA (cytosine(967)-C(5))-methyltransferase RsmB [Burkholderiaceae bacterium]|jgi:16S rRNA (cytosine967-C5)-methyltransferase|nr:16S rRNA (cytosine(967)-C(5))-methyltransferase RsmB [Burkholderiaceae bacterium]